MNPLKIFNFVSLFTVLLVLYLILMLFGVDFSPTAGAMFSLPLISGGIWQPTAGDFLIILGVVFLYIEIFKSTRSDAASIIEHGISMATFLIFLVLFLTLEDAGSSTFLILTLMSLLDVVGGFTVSISTARKDLSLK